MENNKLNSKVIFEELSSETMNPQAFSIVPEQVEEHEHNDEEIPPIQKIIGRASS